MSDTSPEDQATLAIVFEENVRELVRKHIREAFDDPYFIATLPIEFLHSKLEGRSYNGIGFAQSVRDVIKAQMQKY